MGLLLACLPRALEWTVPRLLRARGVAPVSLRVTQLGLHHAVLEDVRVGAAPDLAVARLELRFTPSGLLHLHASELRLVGVRLRATLADGRLSLGALEPLLAGEGGGAGAALPVDRLGVEDLELRLTTPGATLALRGALDVEALARGLRRAALHAELGAPDAPLSGRVALALDPDGSLAASARLRAEAGALAALWPGAGEGSGHLDFDVSGRAPAASEVLAPGGVAAVLRTSRLAGSARLALHAGERTSLDGDLQLGVAEQTLTLKGERVRIASRGLAVDATRLDLALRADASGAIDLERAALAAGRGHAGGLRWREAEVRGSGRLAADGSGELEASLRLGEPSSPWATTSQVELALRARRAPDGALHAELAKPLALALRRADTGADWIHAAVGQLRISAGPPGEEPRRITAGGGEIRLRLPARNLRAEGVSVRLAMSADGREATAAAEGRVVLAGAEPLALAASLTSEASAGGRHLSGRVHDRAQQLQLAVSGDAAADLASGRLRLKLAPLTLSGPGLGAKGPWGRALALDGLGGRVSGALALRWGGERLHGEGSLTLDDLELRRGALQVEGLRGVVHLAELVPPATPPGQRVTFASLRVGVPLTEGELTWHLERGGMLEVERLRGRLAGGHLEAQARWSPTEGARRLALGLTDVDVRTLVDVAGVDALEMTGRAGGGLVLLRKDDALTIASGRFQVSPAGGTIAYRPARPPAALLAIGPHGRMLADALRDFRYQELGLTLDGRLDGDVSAKVDLLGSNPAVQEGRLIELHLRLTTSFPEALRAQRLWARWAVALERGTTAAP